MRRKLLVHILTIFLANASFLLPRSGMSEICSDCDIGWGPEGGGGGYATDTWYDSYTDTSYYFAETIENWEADQVVEVVALREAAPLPADNATEEAPQVVTVIADKPTTTVQVVTVTGTRLPAVGGAESVARLAEIANRRVPLPRKLREIQSKISSSRKALKSARTVLKVAMAYPECSIQYINMMQVASGYAASSLRQANTSHLMIISPFNVLEPGLYGTLEQRETLKSEVIAVQGDASYLGAAATGAIEHCSLEPAFHGRGLE